MTQNIEEILAGAELDQSMQDVTPTYSKEESAYNDKLARLQQATVDKLSTLGTGKMEYATLPEAPLLPALTLGQNQGLAASSQNSSNAERSARAQSIANNIEHSSVAYKPAILDSVLDADTMYVRGHNATTRLAGDPTVNGRTGWVDAPEVSHLGKKSDPKYVQEQMLRYGLKSEADVFKLGEKEKLEALYNLMGRPIGSDGKEWTPGPINYDVVNDPMVLGSKANPLGLQIQEGVVAGTAKGGRDLGYLRSKDGKINQSVELAKEGHIYQNPNAAIGKTTAAKGLTEDTVASTFAAVKGMLGYRESRNNYAQPGNYSVDPKTGERKFAGYIGKYQMGADVLKDLGMVHPWVKNGVEGNRQLNDPKAWTGKYNIHSVKQFLQNPQVQEHLADQHLSSMANEIIKNNLWNGTPEDLAGKLSAGWLKGMGSVRKGDYSKTDANGTLMSTYYNLGVKAAKGRLSDRSYRAQIISNEALKNMKHEGGFGNATAGFGSTLGQMLVQTADMPFEAAEYLGKKAAGKNVSWDDDNLGFFSDSKLENTLNSITGYDAVVMNQRGNDVKEGIKEGWEKGNWGKLGSALWETAKTPELYGQTLAFVVGLRLPGAAMSKVVDTMFGIKNLAIGFKAADETISTADAIKKAQDSAGAGYKLLKAVANQAGNVNYANQFTHDAEKEYQAIYNEPMSAARRSGAFLLGLASANLDNAMSGAIIQGKDLFSVAIKNAFKEATPEVQKGFVSKLAKASGLGTAKILGVMGEEGSTEAIQAGLEKVGARANSTFSNTGDVLTDKDTVYDIATEGVMGAIGGAQMRAPHSAMGTSNIIGGVIADKLKDLRGKDKKVLNDNSVDYEAIQTNVKSIGASTGDLKSAMDTVASYREGVSTLADEGMLDTETEAKYASNVKTIVDSFDKASDETPMTFGSKAGTVNFLSTVIEEKSKGNNGILDAEVEKKLAKIATANGISNDEFKHIKNMANVEQEATLGKRGYISQFNKLVALMENPEENKKAINKTYKQMLGFRDTQVQFAKNLGAAIKEAEAFVAQNKDREKQGLAPLKAKQFEAVMEVEGARKNKHKFVVNATEQGLAAARQVLAKKQQNIEGLSEGLRFYNTQLGAAGVDTELSTKVIVPEKLANFGKLVDKHNITKVITNNTSKGLSKQLNEMQGNASRINNKEYSSDDTVVIDLTSIDKKDLKVKDVKGHKRYLLPDSVAEQIWAAKKAGASIILHRGKADPAISRAVEGYLRQQYGGDKDAKYGALLDNKNKFGPLDVITEKNKDVTTKREEDEKKKKHQHDLKVAYARTLIKPNDDDLKAALKEQFEINKGYFAASEEKSSQEKMEAFVEGQVNKLVKEMLAKMIETGKSHGKEIHVEGGFAEIMELAGQKYMEYKDTMQEVSGVLEEWKKVEADPENELTFGEWLGKQEGIEAASIATHILDNSASNDLGSRVFKQKYKKSKENKTELFKEGTAKTRLDEKVHTDGIVEYERGIDVPLKEYVAVKKEGTVFNSIPIEGLGETINSLVNTWEKYFFGEKGFTSVSFEKDASSKTFTKNDYALIDSPARGVFLIKDSNGDAVVNRNVIAAAITAMYEAISMNSYMMSNKEWKPEEDIKRLHGLKEGQYLSHDSVSTLSRHGILRKTLAEDIGKGMAKLLGLTPLSDSKSDKEQFDRLVADLGHYAMLAGVMSGHLHLTKMSMKQYGELLDKDDNEFAKDLGAIDIGFVHIKEEDLDDREENSTTKVAVIKRKFDMLVEELPEVSTMRKEPSTKPISKRVKEKLKGSIRKDKSGFVPAKEAQEALEHLMNQGYRVNGALIDKVLEYKDAIKTKLGFIELGSKEYEDLSKDKKDVQEAINRDIEKSIEELEVLKGKLSEDINEQEKFRLFFEWYYTKNGRYMMDSNTINPQTDKQLHRFIITPEQHENSYTLKEVKVDEKTKKVVISLTNKDELPEGVKDEEVYQNFLYAMAQAFGIGVDKKSTAMFEEKMQLVLNNYKELDIDKMERDILTTDAKEVPFVTKDGNPLELNGKEVKFEIEHLAHMLQAFQALRAMQAGDQFSTSLTAETDAVTSGFALKLMQMPIIGKSLRYLLKVGIFPKVLLEEGALEHPAVKTFLGNDEDFKNELLSIIEVAKGFDKNKAISMNDILGSGVMKDSYQTLGVDMVDIKPVPPTNAKGEVKDHSGFSNGKIKEKLLTNKDNAWKYLKGVLPSYDVAKGTVDSELRSLFKAPFMTFNYSASITNIRKHLASNLVDGLFEKIMDVNDKDATDLFEKVFKPLNIDDVKKNDLTSLRELLKTTNSFMLKAPGISNVRNELEHLMNITYGAKLEEVMTAQFEEFIKAQDVVNTSFNLMFQVYNAHLQDRVDKVIKANGVITLANMKEVEKDLQKLFPSIKGPLSDVNSQEDLDRIGIIGFGKGSGAGPMAPQTHLSENGKKKYDQNTMKIQYTIKQFAAAVSAGSVVPIHYIDGALMGKLINAMSKIYGGSAGVTAIHDAIMPALVMLGLASRTYNEGVLDVAENFNFIEEVFKSVERSKDRIEKFGDTPVYGAKILGKVVEKTTIAEMAKMLMEGNEKEDVKGLQKLVGDVQTAREMFKNLVDVSGAYVMHLASTKNGVYEYEGKAEVKQNKGTIIEEEQVEPQLYEQLAEKFLTCKQG